VTQIWSCREKDPHSDVTQYITVYLLHLSKFLRTPKINSIYLLLGVDTMTPIQLYYNLLGKLVTRSHTSVLMMHTH